MMFQAHTVINGSDRVIKRIGSDPVLNLYKLRTLSEAEYVSAFKFAKAHTICQGADNGAVDLSIDRVDSAGVIEPLQDYQLEAMDIIRQASKELSREDLLRVEKIAGDGLAAKEYCRSIHKKEHKNFCTEQSELFKDNLAQLAVYWRYERRRAA